MAERLPQSVAKRVLLKVYLSSDHVSPATGKTVAVVISKNGGAFGSPSAGATNATEIANGWYYVDLSTTDTGTAGPLAVRGTSAGCDDAEKEYEVANAHNAGFDGIPNAAAEAAGGLYTRGTGAGQINQDANGRIDVNVTTVADDGTAPGQLVTMLAEYASGFFSASVTAVTGSIQGSVLGDVDGRVRGNVIAALVGPGCLTQLADGVAHGGSSATLRLGAAGAGPAFHVTNAAGDAARFEATAGNGHGLYAAGTGTGDGIHALALSTGRGILAQSGSSQGFCAAGGNGSAGFVAQGGTDASGAAFVGAGSGDGLTLLAGTTGADLTLFNSKSPSLTAVVNAGVAAVKAKTDNLPASPAAVGSAMTLAAGAVNSTSIADGAITDAKIAFPAETPGRPATFLAAVRRLWERFHNKRTRDRSTGVRTIYGADGTTVLEASTQSSTTVGGVTTDAESQGS